jgi:hypothetical protein
MRIAPLESRPIGSAGPAAAGQRVRPLGRAVVLTALLAAVLLATAQPASANTGETIILRCTHNESLSGFSQSAYRQALKELNGDAEEYSGCSSLISQAQDAAAADGRGGGSVVAGQSGATPVAIAATPSEQRTIAHAEHAAPGAVKLDGALVHPGVVRANIASALRSLPTPLLAVADRRPHTAQPRPCR